MSDTAIRVNTGAICLRNSIFRQSPSQANPVALPPGRAKLILAPVRTSDAE